ncbi:MAG: hypothetical protein CME70_19345 [Halobacteriovorax sp.]|nr:hypothetical protein [Halobacteriovorax sp.]MBK26162.1 hypothetical protein [Halobacteriovorax sp.]|tara:strand:+ start:914 stop:1126 length:213 start_codon:yes stop_codon:yes gene_type:complete
MTEKKLSNHDYIFTLLTAVVKKNGGELRISEDELCKVSKLDLVKLLWDPEKSEVVLRVDAMIAPDTKYKN